MKRLSVVFLFVLLAATGVCGQNAAALREAEVYDLERVDTKPFFPGGVDGLMRFMYHNVCTPVEAMNDTAYVLPKLGVVVSLVISKGGKAVFEGCKQNVHPAFVSEIRRVVDLMPLWRPATRYGENVNCRASCNLEILDSNHYGYEVPRAVRWIDDSLRRWKSLTDRQLTMVRDKAGQALPFGRSEVLLNMALVRAMYGQGEWREAVGCLEAFCGQARKDVVELVNMVRKGKEARKRPIERKVQGPAGAFLYWYDAMSRRPLAFSNNAIKADLLMYASIMKALLYAAGKDSVGFVNCCDSVMSDWAFVSSNGVVSTPGVLVSSDPYYRRERSREVDDMLGGESRNAVRRRVEVSKDADIDRTVGNVSAAVREGVVDDAQAVQSEHRLRSLKEEMKARYNVNARSRYAKLMRMLLALRDRPIDEVAVEVRPMLLLAARCDENDSKAVRRKKAAELKRMRRRSGLLRGLAAVESKIRETEWVLLSLDQYKEWYRRH